MIQFIPSTGDTQLAYINQAEKAAIAANIKPLLKQYGLKGSLSIKNHSTIQLTIKSGKLDFIGNAKKVGRLQYAIKDDISPTPYHFKDHFDGEVLEFLTKAFAALKGEGWFDNSDIQSDYFNTKHYYDISCGTWNQPYQLMA